MKVRKLEGDVTIQRLNVLLEVYLNGTLDQSTLIKKAKLSRGSTSKNVASWAKLNAYKKPAPGYIISTPDPMNLKTRILEITPRGKAVVESMFD